MVKLPEAKVEGIFVGISTVSGLFATGGSLLRLISPVAKGSRHLWLRPSLRIAGIVTAPYASASPRPICRSASRGRTKRTTAAANGLTASISAHWRKEERIGRFVVGLPVHSERRREPEVAGGPHLRRLARNSTGVSGGILRRAGTPAAEAEEMLTGRRADEEAAEGAARSAGGSDHADGVSGSGAKSQELPDSVD